MGKDLEQIKGTVLAKTNVTYVQLSYIQIKKQGITRKTKAQIRGTAMDEYIVVKSIIDEWDPIGLLNLGCPEDEYDPEIKDIVALLPNVKSVDELALRIRQVFIKWFEEFISIEKCYPVASKIWEAAKKT